MQTVATRPTAKQMLTAKRAAKKSTQQDRALKRAGTVKNVDRNRLSTSSKAQKENIDVRQPMMKMLAANKGSALVQAVKDSEDIIRHCDNGTGFSCFNWTKHFKRAANLIGLMKQEDLLKA